MGDFIDPCYRPPEHLRPQIRKIAKKMLQAMRKRAFAENWALGVHGSMERDLDIIAVPWTQDAISELDFLKAMQDAISKVMEAPCYRSKFPTIKPNGRRAYTLYSGSERLVYSEAGTHPFIDLSIMDIRNIYPTEESSDGKPTSD